MSVLKRMGGLGNQESEVERRRFVGCYVAKSTLASEFRMDESYAAARRVLSSQ
jgi:hypothetical protein